MNIGAQLNFRFPFIDWARACPASIEYARRILAFERIAENGRKQNRSPEGLPQLTNACSKTTEQQKPVCYNSGVKAKIRTRLGSRKESLKYATEVAAKNYHNAANDARDIDLPDGNREAIRVYFNRDNGEVIRDKGQVRICAPWLLSGVFG